MNIYILIYLFFYKKAIKKKKVSPRFELGPKDSESFVLTATL